MLKLRIPIGSDLVQPLPRIFVLILKNDSKELLQRSQYQFISISTSSDSDIMKFVCSFSFREWNVTPTIFTGATNTFDAKFMVKLPCQGEETGYFHTLQTGQHLNLFNLFGGNRPTS
ncbi:unnamed protein product [Cuscuta europaea]|uniref:Uncharacterized protein n=1 Tax=Cuscuta europaea TaxID=41803 RepID=A0A9P1EDS4_CUSEU|nr:unnamed protein product [Cuscuta europaea]